MADEPLHHGRIADPAADSGERTYAMFNHLIGLLSLASGGIGIAGLIGAVVMWRIKAKESPFLDDHGREAVNFQITLLAYFIAGLVLAAILAVVTIGLASPLIAAATPVCAAALIVLNLVGCIRGAIAANRGEYYRYPMCIRILTAAGE